MEDSRPATGGATDRRLLGREQDTGVGVGAVVVPEEVENYYRRAALLEEANDAEMFLHEQKKFCSTRTNCSI